MKTVKRKIIDASEVARVRALDKIGVPKSEIAKNVGVSKSTVYQIVENFRNYVLRFDADMVVQINKMTDELVEEMKARALLIIDKADKVVYEKLDATPAHQAAYIADVYNKRWHRDKGDLPPGTDPDEMPPQLQLIVNQVFNIANIKTDETRDNPVQSS